jgi:hypothetical protein
MGDPQWRQFESAVATFVAALDSTATVKHDVRLPDRHTQRPRQRDVWVEARVCQHFPVNVLISCKRWRRTMSQTDIDAFNGECQSAGAQVGVIYAFGGYTKPALEKAEQLGCL